MSVFGKYCSSYRENSLLSLLLLLQLTLWKFCTWVQTQNLFHGFYFVAFLSVSFGGGDLHNPYFQSYKAAPVPPSALFSLFFWHSSLHPPFHFIIVEFTGITVVGNWGKSVIWRRLSPQGHIFWRYELLVKPQPSYQTRSASSGCCCDVRSQILQAAHLLCCVPIKVLLCAVSFLNMH